MKKKKKKGKDLHVRLGAVQHGSGATNAKYICTRRNTALAAVPFGYIGQHRCGTRVSIFAWRTSVNYVISMRRFLHSTVISVTVQPEIYRGTVGSNPPRISDILEIELNTGITVHMEFEFFSSP